MDNSGHRVCGRPVFGIAPRSNEGQYELPSSEENDWEWTFLKKLIIQKDYALAATNAVKDIWDPSNNKFIKGMCSVHASTRWFSNNPKYFNNKGKDRSLPLQKDIKLFKIVPCIHMVPLLRKKMMDRWKNIHKEPVVAEHWMKSWEGSTITRVEMSTYDPLRGGIPSDNNFTEVCNRINKVLMNYRRVGLVRFLPDLGDLIQGHSQTDLLYTGQMQSPVISFDFLKRVYDITENDREKKPTCLLLQFPFTMVKIGAPKGSYIIAGETCVNNICLLAPYDQS